MLTRVKNSNKYNFFNVNNPSENFFKPLFLGLENLKNEHFNRKCNIGFYDRYIFYNILHRIFMWVKCLHIRHVTSDGSNLTFAIL